MFALEHYNYVNIVNFRPPLTLPEFAQVVGALGSLLLTGGLVYLYSRQTAILNEEKQQTEFQSKALLRVEDVRIIPCTKARQVIEDKEINLGGYMLHSDFVEIEISNFGRAPAEQLRVEALLHGDEYGWEAQSPLVKGNWLEAAETLAGRSGDVLRLNDNGAPIGSDERNITYTASLIATRSELEDEWETQIPIDESALPTQFYSASEILWELQDAGESEIDAGIRLWFKDGIGRREPLNLKFATAESPKISNIEEALEFGRPMMPDEIPSSEDWWDSE